MELKDRIIKEASGYFFNHGVRSMTMSDIANALGISKRTLYEVFRDKDELLESCIDNHTEKVDQEMKDLFKGSEDVINSFMRIYAKHLREVHSINKTVFSDLKKYYPHLFQKIESKQKEGLEIFIPLLKRGVEEKLIRNDVNFEILFWLVKVQFKALMDDEYIPKNRYSTDEFIRAIILVFVRGIATPLGNEKIDTIIDELNKQL